MCHWLGQCSGRIDGKAAGTEAQGTGKARGTRPSSTADGVCLLQKAQGTGKASGTRRPPPAPGPLPAARLLVAVTVPVPVVPVTAVAMVAVAFVVGMMVAASFMMGVRMVPVMAGASVVAGVMAAVIGMAMVPVVVSPAPPGAGPVVPTVVPIPAIAPRPPVIPAAGIAESARRSCRWSDSCTGRWCNPGSGGQAARNSCNDTRPSLLVSIHTKSFSARALFLTHGAARNSSSVR